MFSSAYKKKEKFIAKMNIQLFSFCIFLKIFDSDSEWSITTHDTLNRGYNGNLKKILSEFDCLLFSIFIPKMRNKVQE